MSANCVILEGSWWKAHEPPLILPWFQTLATMHRFNLSHRTIRSADDIEFWIRKIPANSRSLVYFACHGESQDLLPVGTRSRVTRKRLLTALEKAKTGAIAFLHFGCCEMVDRTRRRASLQELSDAASAYWVSGYTTSVDWLQSTMLDLAFFADVYVQFARQKQKPGPKLQANAKRFFTNYNQLARSLGFSGLSYSAAGSSYRLFPAKLH